MKNFKKLLTTLLLLCSTMAFAENVVIDGIVYELDTTTLEATITVGESKYKGDVVIPSVIVYNDATYNVTNIGAKAFYECSELTKITIPNSVTNISARAFENCVELTELEIPSSITNIGNYAFKGCVKLTNVTIPNSVENVGRSSFENCTGITDIIIGSGVKNIYNGAFKQCEKLVNVYCLATTVPYAVINAFSKVSVESVTLYVPIEAINDYKTTEPWNSFGTIIELDEETTNIANITIVGDVDSSNGNIFVTSPLEGECVVVYTSNGTLVGTDAITNGSATIHTDLLKGTVVIVKIGKIAFKTIMQ